MYQPNDEAPLLTPSEVAQNLRALVRVIAIVYSAAFAVTGVIAWVSPESRSSIAVAVPVLVAFFAYSLVYFTCKAKSVEAESRDGSPTKCI